MTCSESMTPSWLDQRTNGSRSAAGGPGGRLCYDALSLQAASHIMRKYAAVKFKMPSAQGHFRPAHARLIEDYIQQNISRNITLDELAAICNCTQIQFARKFHAHYGIRPHAPLFRNRKSKGVPASRRDNLALKEIARLSGFADQSHLNRVFRGTSIVRRLNIARVSRNLKPFWSWRRRPTFVKVGKAVLTRSTSLVHGVKRIW